MATALELTWIEKLRQWRKHPLSIAEAGGVKAVPGYVRTIELLEASGRLDRKVEGLASSEELGRRSQEGRGLTRTLELTGKLPFKQV